MKRVWLSVLAVALGTILVAGNSTFAQTKPSKAPTQKQTVNKPVTPEMLPAKDKASAEKDASKPRLPSGFAKLNLSQEQHSRVLKIQEQFSHQIKEIETQLAAVKAKRDHELQAVLTPQQKSAYAEAREARKNTDEKGSVKPADPNSTDKSAPTAPRRRGLRNRRAANPAT
jgi:hypothetical protein